MEGIKMSKTDRMPLDWLARRTAKKISDREEVALNIVLNYGKPTPMMVVLHDLIAKRVGSFVSCHTALASLQKNNFIKVVVDSKDNRRKLCEITAKGKGYFDI
jgi:DNA-binding MarR family transcriptional regulator